MSPKTSTTTKWALASYALRDAFTDFILSRQAIPCSARTMGFYNYTLTKFITWLDLQGVNKPDEVTARLVRSYLAELTARGLADTTLHGNARAIKTLVRFWQEEGYLLNAIKFTMPRLTQKRLPVVTAEQVEIILHACQNPREKAIILLLVDTGTRLNETISLDWGDVDIMTGLIRVRKGKGGKARSVVAGASTRRALLAYRRTLQNTTDNAPLIQTYNGSRFAGHGLHQVFKRLEERSGVPFSAHALRRAFTILSLRSGMDVLHLQALGGWSSLAMVNHYAQLVDDDLLAAHHQYSPIDNLARLK